jgi:hypothetical protein
MSRRRDPAAKATAILLGWRERMVPVVRTDGTIRYVRVLSHVNREINSFWPRRDGWAQAVALSLKHGAKLPTRWHQ